MDGVAGGSAAGAVVGGGTCGAVVSAGVSVGEFVLDEFADCATAGLLKAINRQSIDVRA
jgi:hypothetical protein